MTTVLLVEEGREDPNTSIGGGRGSSQTWTGFRDHFYAFYGLFLKSMYRMGICFGLLKFQICFVYA